MASEEELLAATGYLPGTVTPFGLPRPMRVLVDRCILDLPEVSLGSGQRGPDDSHHPRRSVGRLPNQEMVDFSSCYFFSYSACFGWCGRVQSKFNSSGKCSVRLW